MWGQDSFPAWDEEDAGDDRGRSEQARLRAKAGSRHVLPPIRRKSTGAASVDKPPRPPDLPVGERLGMLWDGRDALAFDTQQPRRQHVTKATPLPPLARDKTTRRQRSQGPTFSSIKTHPPVSSVAVRSLSPSRRFTIRRRQDMCAQTVKFNKPDHVPKLHEIPLGQLEKEPARKTGARSPCRGKAKTCGRNVAAGRSKKRDVSGEGWPRYGPILAAPSTKTSRSFAATRPSHKKKAARRPVQKQPTRTDQNLPQTSVSQSRQSRTRSSKSRFGSLGARSHQAQIVAWWQEELERRFARALEDRLCDTTSSSEPEIVDHVELDPELRSIRQRVLKMAKKYQADLLPEYLPPEVKPKRRPIREVEDDKAEVSEWRRKLNRIEDILSKVKARKRAADLNSHAAKVAFLEKKLRLLSMERSRRQPLLDALEGTETLQDYVGEKELIPSIAPLVHMDANDYLDRVNYQLEELREMRKELLEASKVQWTQEYVPLGPADYSSSDTDNAGLGFLKKRVRWDLSSREGNPQRERLSGQGIKAEMRSSLTSNDVTKKRRKKKRKKRKKERYDSGRGRLSGQGKPRRRRRKKRKAAERIMHINQFLVPPLRRYFSMPLLGPGFQDCGFDVSAILKRVTSKSEQKKTKSLTTSPRCWQPTMPMCPGSGTDQSQTTSDVTTADSASSVTSYSSGDTDCYDEASSELDSHPSPSPQSGEGKRCRQTRRRRKKRKSRSGSRSSTATGNSSLTRSASSRLDTSSISSDASGYWTSTSSATGSTRDKSPDHTRTSSIDDLIITSHYKAPLLGRSLKRTKRHWRRCCKQIQRARAKLRLKIPVASEDSDNESL